jgi:hypothetical protein
MSDYDWAQRQAELNAIPPKKTNFSEWPKGVRAIGVDEMDALGVDAQGMIYWHGRPIALRRIELRGWEFWFALLATVGAFLSGIAAMFPALPRLFGG